MFFRKNNLVMPGIAGIISASPRQSAAEVEAMLECMMHENFYEAGTYRNDPVGLRIGWVCHQNSFSHCLPIWNENKDVCLLFAGENFADPAELEELKARGHEFEPGNASYLVHLYEELGPAFFEKLNGWFSGVLLDLRARTAVLFNDRYGFERVYYHENDQGLYFASEAKALLKVLPKLRQIDARGLAEFYSCGCALQNRTIFSGISLLPGASRWTFQQNQPARKEAYFRKETWETQARLTGQEFYERLKATFSRLLPKYFRSSQPVGMSLTGGLDGRMIMAWAGCSPGSLPCYTFGGSYRDCTDVKIARKVAQLCGQHHQVIPVDGEFLGQFPACAERAIYTSDGAMDVIGAVEIYVNRIARTIAPVRMTGNYGSEILRGHVAFKPHDLNETFYDSTFVELGQKARTTYRGEAEGRRLSFVAFKQVPWHHRSRLSVEQSQLTLRSPYLDTELVSLMYQAPDDLAFSNGPSLRLSAEGNQALGRIPTDRGLLHAPVPLLTGAHHLYEEFTFKAEYAYDYGMPQWVAQVDHLFKPLRLERLFLGRHKFSHFRVWYRDKLSNYLKEIILDPRTRNRPYLQGASLEAMLQSHINGSRNYTLDIHRILSAELVQRQLVERQWNGAP
jgi:asparagine synthase (glutamine-hydrolysing)